MKRSAPTHSFRIRHSAESGEGDVEVEAVRLSHQVQRSVPIE
ncbi:MAG: hypothetical protein V8T12_05770 [Parabacteroides johnsonii]